MIRSDNLDMGLWKGYLPRDLLYPVDTHILRFAGATGIVTNNNNSIKISKEITSFLQRLIRMTLLSMILQSQGLVCFVGVHMSEVHIVMSAVMQMDVLFN